MSERPGQPSDPQEQIGENQETAEKALEIAGFQINDYVNVPYSDAEEMWQIKAPTIVEFYGRNVPAVILQDKNRGNLRTITLYDLCIYNPPTESSFSGEPDTSQVPNIGNHLTKGKFVYLRKVEGEKERIIFFGWITNSPIEIGKPIASSCERETHSVKSITIKGNRYIIQTEDGQTFIFDPSEAPDALETD